MDDKKWHQSKKFLMLFYIATWILSLQIFGKQLEPTVASTMLLIAGAYAGVQGWNDNSKTKKTE